MSSPATPPPPPPPPPPFLPPSLSAKNSTSAHLPLLRKTRPMPLTPDWLPESLRVGRVDVDEDDDDVDDDDDEGQEFMANRDGGWRRNGGGRYDLMS